MVNVREKSYAHANRDNEYYLALILHCHCAVRLEHKLISASSIKFLNAIFFN